MTQTQTTPPLYSYGVASIRDGQSIQLTALTADAIMRSDWTLAFRVRIRGYGSGGCLLQILAGEMEVQLGQIASSSTTPNNRVRAIFHGNQVVDSEVELQVGTWHNVVVTVARSGNTAADVTIYIDGAPFGAPTATPTHIDHYSYNNSGQHPILGGGVDAEFTRVTLWQRVLGGTEIIETALEPPTSAGLLHAFDFTTRTQDGTYALNKGAQVVCAFPCTTFAGGVATPAAADGLAPGSDLSQPFTIQAWIQSSPPVAANAPLDMTIVGNGDVDDATAFAFGLAYSADRSAFSLRAVVPGQSQAILDSTQLQPGVGYNVALTWDTSNLEFWVDGRRTSTVALPASSPGASPAALAIGATNSAATGSGFSRFYLGRMQSLGIWDRVLTGTELGAYATPPVSLTEGMTAQYDLVTPEFSNNVTGRRLSFQGLLTLTEALDANVAPCPARDAVPQLPGDDVVFNLADLQAINEMIDEHGSRASGPLPGSVTWVTEGNERVFHFHTAAGPVEVLRVDAATVDECNAWRISMLVTAVAIVLCVVGLAFSASSLTKALYRVWTNSAGFRARVKALGDSIATPSGVLMVISALYDTGSLKYTLECAFANMSWWDRAYAVASLVLYFASIFASGGWAIVVIVATIQLNIAALAYTYRMRPKGCTVSG